ncbi:MAG: glutathione S-transferase family protein [Gammaproteobacteria bacterium]
MTKALLVIGNRNYSSWSLRGWLALAKSGAEFEVRRLALGTPEFRSEIGRYSPSGRVPVLHHTGRIIWDSLAIGEYANETFAGDGLWPTDTAARAHARSASAEMHSGFAALRSELPMNCRARDRRVVASPALEHDVERIRTLWRESREHFGADGPWLYGRWSIADAMYAPVASRFHTYGIELDGLAAEYAATALADSDLEAWMSAAAAEPEVLDEEERGRPPEVQG